MSVHRDRQADRTRSSSPLSSPENKVRKPREVSITLCMIWPSSGDADPRSTWSLDLLVGADRQDNCCAIPDGRAVQTVVYACPSLSPPTCALSHVRYADADTLPTTASTAAIVSYPCHLSEYHSLPSSSIAAANHCNRNHVQVVICTARGARTCSLPVPSNTCPSSAITPPQTIILSTCSRIIGIDPVLGPWNTSLVGGCGYGPRAIVRFQL